MSMVNLVFTFIRQPGISADHFAMHCKVIFEQRYGSNNHRIVAIWACLSCANIAWLCAGVLKYSNHFSLPQQKEMPACPANIIKQFTDRGCKSLHDFLAWNLVSSYLGVQAKYLFSWSRLGSRRVWHLYWKLSFWKGNQGSGYGAPSKRRKGALPKRRC